MFLKSIKIFILVFLFTFVSNEIKAQVSTYTFIDPCTKEVTLFSVPLQGGKTTIIFLNQVGSFDANDMSNGVFSNWVNQVYTTYRQTNPCSQQQGQVTQNQITAQIIGSTVQTIVSSILSSSQSQTTSTQVDGGGGGDDAGGKGGGNSDNKKKNNNNNSQGNGSNNSNGTSTNSSSTQSGGQPQTGSGTSGSNGSTTGSQGSGSSTSGGGSTGSGNSTEGGSSTTQPPVGSGSGSGSSGNSGNGGGATGSGTTGGSGSGNGSSGNSGNGGGSGTTGSGTGTGNNSNGQKTEEVGATTTMNNDAHNDNGSSSGGSSSGGKGGKSGGGNARSNPIIVSSDITNAQNLNKSYTPIVNIGTSRSSMTGLSSAGVTAMVWLNFQQYALSARYTKIHYNKSKKLKFVHNLNLTGVYTYGNYLGFLGYSGILNGGKWGITGFNVSGAVTIITEEKNGYYSPSITAFYTRPFKVNKKLIISPELYVISTPLVYSSKEQVSISDRYFSGFIGSGFDYQISKRFKLNVNYKANLSTNPKFPILSFFLIGSKINL